MSPKIFMLMRRSISQKILDLWEKVDQKKPNAFKLFGIDERFNVDKLKLQSEMRNLQKSLHPDKFVGYDSLAQEKSLQLSAMINDLYQVLRNPYERGKYLLSLMTDTSQAQLEQRMERIQLDPEFLARMMDISEKAQTCTFDRRELDKLIYQLDAEIAELSKNLDEKFAAKRFDDIAIDLAKLKFLTNCYDSLTERFRLFSTDNINKLLGERDFSDQQTERNFLTHKIPSCELEFHIQPRASQYILNNPLD